MPSPPSKSVTTTCLPAVRFAEFIIVAFSVVFVRVVDKARWPNARRRRVRVRRPRVVLHLRRRQKRDRRRWISNTFGFGARWFPIRQPQVRPRKSSTHSLFQPVTVGGN